jgi:copper homeostasis protein
MLREFCVENLTNVEKAIRAGAARVELCEDLSVGGVTPSPDVIASAVRLTHRLGATVMVMVRPRGGDFAYDERELRSMEESICTARDLGADGVVFGCVREGALDEPAAERLAYAARELDLTFHMAFDEIDPPSQADALRRLASLGFSRVLAHGGPLSQPIDECLPRLRHLAHAAEGRIVVMPGGGVTWENAGRICARLGVAEAHGTRIVRM